MLLLEALTHASYTGPHALCSYERLEFLGDAVLDQIISTRMFSHQPALSHKKMHGIRSAMVNASFLAFRAIETTITETIVDKTSFREEEHPRSLWQFMRFSEPHLQTARKMALKLHAAARIQILDAMEQDERFPWHLLGLLDSPKELSDMVESVLGAIYIDTCGDLAACEAYCRRLGILDCLDHILRNGVDCFHPKERLGVLAVDCRVNYISCKVGGAVDINEGPWRCQVQVNGEMVGGVVPGLKRLSAETMAAYRACLVMERQMDMVMSDDDEVFFDAEESGGVRLDS